MPSLTRILVEPFYRLIFGRPIDDALPWRNDVPVDSAPIRALNGKAAGRLQGLVLVAGGVGGFELCGTGLRFVLGAEGLNYAVHVVPWGHGFARWFADLTDVEHCHLKAAMLAGMVREFQARQASEPVFLVGKSGGCGLVVKALEELEPDSVERAILLAPALSPRYDLSEALRAVKQELVVFWSPLDVFFLGMGTRIFGTMDRVRTAGAGLVGFCAPDASTGESQKSDNLYTKLRQVRWSPRMVAHGYLGGHLGPDSPVFLKNYVVPLLRTGTEGVR